MPIQLSCSQCGKRMVVRDDVAGTSITCPKCKNPVAVPKEADAVKVEDLMAQPRQAAKAGEALVEHALRRTCQYCGADLPLTGEYCLKCYKHVQTGKRLPWVKRFGQKSAAYRLTVVVGGLMGVFLVALVVTFIRGREGGGDAGYVPPHLPAPPNVEETLNPDQIVQQLIVETDSVKRDTLLRDLASRGGDAVAAIRKVVRGEIVAKTEQGDRPPSDLDVQSCVLLLARIEDPSADQYLQELFKIPRVQDLAATAIAQKKGEAGLRKMLPAYFETVRRLTLESYWDARKLQDNLDPLRAVLDLREIQLREFRNGAVVNEDRGLAAMLERYWDSWDWLGSNRGEAWMREIDRVEDLVATTDPAPAAKGSFADSAEGENMESIYGDDHGVTNEAALQEIEEVLTKVETLKNTEGRKAFEWLNTVIKMGTPDQRMVAALYIARRASPSEEDRKAYARIIGNLFAHPEKLIRQRAVWTYCNLTARVISWYWYKNAPFEVDDDIILAAAQDYKLVYGKEPSWAAPKPTEEGASGATGAAEGGDAQARANP